MNIRSVSNPTIASEIKVSTESKQVKLGESHQDRDADGRREQPEPDKSPLNEEELKKAKEYFEGLEALKANGLTITLEDTSSSSLRLFIIKDHLGTVVRRIPEHEMRLLIQDKDRKSGKIFDRAG